MKKQKPKAREIETPSRSDQPSRAELWEAFDLAGADTETVREASFTPIKVRKRGKRRR